MEKNLAAYYKNSNFKPGEMLHLMYGTDSDLIEFNKTGKNAPGSFAELIKKITNLLHDDPIVKYDYSLNDLSRKEWMKVNLQKWARIREVIIENNLPLPDNSLYVKYGF